MGMGKKGLFYIRAKAWSRNTSEEIWVVIILGSDYKSDRFYHIRDLAQIPM